MGISVPPRWTEEQDEFLIERLHFEKRGTWPKISRRTFRESFQRKIPK
ncbi:uncharacterized protein G2W53_028748 [Senna tora]|uniref:Uncharacterized protein n=1 Tax=Senna tora TaxID=362788 RepID=A0A834T2W0_9FABA|nr:uncharacterized protein G2W53_028748 [Senna tora]